MIYKRFKEIHNFTLFGIHDEYRNSDGSSTDNSLRKSQQTKDLTPYITTYESDVVNSKIVRFNLNNCFNHKQLPDNSYIYLNSLKLPILNDGDRQYFTNLKLITGGDITKDYNNLSNDDPILATVYNTSTIAYDPELPITSTTTYVIDQEDTILPQVTTYTTYTIVNTDKGSTTTITKTETAVSNYTDYLNIKVNTVNVNPGKIYYKNDWFFQVYNTDQTNIITTNQDILCDILLVGAGGYGGLGVYGGGGGGGEIVSVSDYYMPAGVYNINVKSQSNYTPTDVRQYPPKTYQSETGNITVNADLYRQTITLDNTGITYGVGNYVITASSYTVGNGLENIFNRIISTTPNYLTETLRYATTTGVYTGNNYLVSNTFKGEWVHIKLPVAISLCYYNFVSNSSTTTRSPSLFKIYGSNDGINWDEIVQASNDTTPLTSANYPTYFGIGYSSTTTLMPRYKKILSTPSQSYQYFGLVVNKIIGGGGETRFGLNEWELFGYEDVYSNSIPKLNILSHYRDIIPKVYTSVADLGTTTQNGSTNYKWSMTLDSSGVETNEAGVYEITATGSATYTTGFPYNILARTTNASTFTCNTTASYTDGVYNGGRYLESSSYKGEWFYVKLPTIRPLYGFSLMFGSQTDNLPGEWKFYGSMNGGSWVEITDGSQSTRIAKTDYVQNGSYYYYSKYFTNPTSYLYYGICCNKMTTTGTTTLVWGNELYLLTKDTLTITDKPTGLDGSVSLSYNNNQILKAKAGGNGGYLNFNNRTPNFYTYPPKLYNSASSESTGNYLGKTGVYYQTITLTTTGITYGSGTYYLYSSTTAVKSDMFNYSNADIGALWAANQYTSATGLYASTTNFIVSGYYGDWLVVQFPEAISLSSLQIVARSPPQIARAPGLWRTYGSNDGTTFTLLSNFSNDTTSLNTSDYAVGNSPAYSYTKSSASATPFYTYIGFCVNKLCGTGNTFMNIVELKFFGNKFSFSNPTSGGSGGGGGFNTAGAIAGNPYQTYLTNTMYIQGETSNGSDGTSTQGGNGGQAIHRIYNTTGTATEYAKSGIGATNNSTPTTKTVYGEGGDGNGGLPMTGTVIIRFKEIGTATETSSTSVVVYQPFSITYNNDYINTEEILLNSYKVPSNLLSKGYLEFEISSIQSGGNIRFLKDELDRLVINASIFSL